MNLSGYPDLEVLSNDLCHFVHLVPTVQMHKGNPNTLEMWQNFHKCKRKVKPLWPQWEKKAFKNGLTHTLINSKNQRKNPSFVQEIQETDGAIRVHVAVIDRGVEVDLGRLKRIVIPGSGW